MPKLILTDEQEAKLEFVAKLLGKSPDEVIRLAIAKLLHEGAPQNTLDEQQKDHTR